MHNYNTNSYTPVNEQKIEILFIYSTTLYYLTMASYDKLIEIFGDIPTVNFGPEVVGSTGYIDKIKVEDMG